MKGISPTQNSLKFMRSQGYLCNVVEHWNPFARRRVDLFNIIDLVCIRPGKLVGVQCTSRGGLSARRRKIRESAETAQWLASGSGLQIHGWYKEKNRWKPVVDIVEPLP